MNTAFKVSYCRRNSFELFQFKIENCVLCFTLYEFEITINDKIEFHYKEQFNLNTHTYKFTVYFTVFFLFFQNIKYIRPSDLFLTFWGSTERKTWAATHNNTYSHGWTLYCFSQFTKVISCFISFKYLLYFVHSFCPLFVLHVLFGWIVRCACWKMLCVPI